MKRSCTRSGRSRRPTSALAAHLPTPVQVLFSLFFIVFIVIYLFSLFCCCFFSSLLNFDLFYLFFFLLLLFSPLFLLYRCLAKDGDGAQHPLRRHACLRQSRSSCPYFSCLPDSCIFFIFSSRLFFLFFSFAFCFFFSSFLFVFFISAFLFCFFFTVFERKRNNLHEFHLEMAKFRSGIIYPQSIWKSDQLD